MKSGDKVKFTGKVTNEQVQWGGHTDPRGLLDVNKEYTIKKIKVHTWHTKIYLEEFPDCYFNSVWFV